MDLFFPVNFTDDPNKIGKCIKEYNTIEGNTYYETPEFIQRVKHCFLDMLLCYIEHSKTHRGTRV